MLVRDPRDRRFWARLLRPVFPAQSSCQRCGGSWRLLASHHTAYKPDSVQTLERLESGCGIQGTVPLDPERGIQMVTMYDLQQVVCTVAALCERCFRECTPAERWPYYLSLFRKWSVPPHFARVERIRSAVMSDQ